MPVAPPSNVAAAWSTFITQVLHVFVSQLLGFLLAAYGNIHFPNSPILIGAIIHGIVEYVVVLYPSLAVWLVLP